MYWRPVLQFIRARGYAEADAQDLTQDFFVRFSQDAFLEKARARFPRFRSLIFSALRHLLYDRADHDGAEKRGGGLQFLSLEEWLESESAPPGPANEAAAGATRLFDYEWAAVVVQNALARLEDEWLARGKPRHFAVLQPFLTTGGESPACAEPATALGLPLGTVKAMIHRLRGRYRTLLREEVSQTLADASDLQDELRHLRQILASLPEIAAERAR